MLERLELGVFAAMAIGLLLQHLLLTKAKEKARSLQDQLTSNGLEKELANETSKANAAASNYDSDKLAYDEWKRRNPTE